MTDNIFTWLELYRKNMVRRGVSYERQIQGIIYLFKKVIENENSKKKLEVMKREFSYHP